MEELVLKYVPDFGESNFKSFVDNVFVQIYLAAMENDLERVKHFVNDEVYRQIGEQILSLREQGLVQVYDELNVKETMLIGARVEGNSLLIQVHLTSRYLDYLVDFKGNYVRGNRDVRVEKENYLTFERKIGAKLAGKIQKCFGCGAVIDVNHNGKCDYCGTIYDLEKTGWVLVRLEVR